jgi:hypothetical protein
LRDGFADALKGIAVREEVEDTVSEAPAVLAMPKRLSERTESAAPDLIDSKAESEPGPLPPAEPETPASPPAPEGPRCQKCGGKTKLIPAGVSKSKIVEGVDVGQKPYPAFWICVSRLEDGSECKWSIKDAEWKKTTPYPLDPKPTPKLWAEGSDPDPMSEAGIIK